MGQAAMAVAQPVMSIGSDIAQYGTTANALNTATNVQNQGYTQSIQGMLGQQQQSQQAWNPYQSLGTNALQQLQSPNGIQMAPGYQFAANSGIQAMLTGMNASGNLNNPATSEALAAYGQGIGQQGYQQAFNNLMSQVQVGQQATGSATNQGFNIQNMLNNLYQGQSGMQAGSAMAGAANQNQLIGGIQGSLQGAMGGMNGMPSFGSKGGGGGGPASINPMAMGSAGTGGSFNSMFA